VILLGFFCLKLDGWLMMHIDSGNHLALAIHVTIDLRNLTCWQGMDTVSLAGVLECLADMKPSGQLTIEDTQFALTAEQPHSL